MALLYQATLTPSKLELVGAWAPSQPWFAGEADVALTPVAAYRFDDPDGEVGIETVLVRAGDGPILHVPLTYRAAPLPGAEQWLIGTMQHSVLGERWTYDAVGDPVYVAVLATIALTGGTHAELTVQTDDGLVVRKPNADVVGSGAPDAAPVLPARVANIATRSDTAATVIEAGNLRVVLPRVILPGAVHETIDASATVTGTWTDQPDATTLAIVTSS